MLPAARLRRFADGSYALAVADQKRGRYTLIKGDAGRARVVHVDGKQWTEASAVEVLVPAGTATRTIAVSGEDGALRRRSLTRYPLGTVLDDLATIGSDGVRNASSAWTWNDGNSAEALWSPQGERTLTYFDVDKRAERRFVTKLAGDAFQTEITGTDGAVEGNVVTRWLSEGLRQSEIAYEGADGSVIIHYNQHKTYDGVRTTVEIMHPDAHMEHFE